MPRVLCCVAQAIAAADVRMLCNAIISEIACSEENLAQLKDIVALKASFSKSTASGSGGGATESSRAGDSASAE